MFNFLGVSVEQKQTAEEAKKCVQLNMGQLAGNKD